MQQTLFIYFFDIKTDIYIENIYIGFHLLNISFFLSFQNKLGPPSIQFLGNEGVSSIRFSFDKRFRKDTTCLDTKVGTN